MIAIITFDEIDFIKHDLHNLVFTTYSTIRINLFGLYFEHSEWKNRYLLSNQKYINKYTASVFYAYFGGYSQLFIRMYNLGNKWCRACCTNWINPKDLWIRHCSNILQIEYKKQLHLMCSQTGSLFNVM